MTRAPFAKSESGLVWAIAAVVACYRVWNLSAFPLHEDETATIMAMKAIVETGMPMTDTGELYWRALLAHYLMAVPFFFADVSEISARLVPAVASAAVLPLAHSMCARAGDRTAGWIAVTFLSVSSLEAYLASFARHYLLFQLAFTATVYYASRYFVDRSNRTGRYLLAATLATVFTHQLSVEIAVVGVVALLVGGHYQPLKTKRFWIGAAVVALALFIVIGIPTIVKPSWVFVNRLARPLPFGGMVDKSALYFVLKSFLPLGLSFAVAGLIPIWQHKHKVWRFYLLCLAGCLLLVSFTAPVSTRRYIANLLPLAAVTASLSMCWLVRNARDAWSSLDKRFVVRGPAGPVLSAICVFALHLTLVHDWSFGTAFGMQSRSPDQRPHHEFIKQRLRDDDLVISVEPGLTRAYLNRPADYFLCEKRDRDRRIFVPFSELEKSSSSIPVIDSPSKLARVIDEHPGRIWVYVNQKAPLVLSKDSISIFRTFPRVMVTDVAVVLLREAKPTPGESRSTIVESTSELVR